MAQKLQQQLKEVGSKLENPPFTEDSLIKFRKILAILADVLIEIQEQVLPGNNEDSDWEEVQVGDVETNEDLLYSAGAATYSRSTYEYLDAMAKTFNEDQNDGYEHDLRSAALPLTPLNETDYSG